MSFYPQGMALKALLEKPELLQAPQKLDDGNPKDKEADLDFEGHMFASQSAFLGPQLWDKTVTYDEADIKLEFMDIEEFLSETCTVDFPRDGGGSPQEQQGQAVNNSVQSGQEQCSPTQPLVSEAEQTSPILTQSQLRSLLVNGPELPLPTSRLATIEPATVKSVTDGTIAGADAGTGQSPTLDPLDCIVNSIELTTSTPQSLSPTQNSMSPKSMMSVQSPTHQPPSPVHHPTPKRGSDSDDMDSDGEDFDPRCRSFTEEELRPQPLIKKSRKIFVPDDLKDDKYWARRRKNNVAARRSRDARRTKENQIALRALFLERQSEKLMVELEQARVENDRLRARLSKYEPHVTAKH